MITSLDRHLLNGFYVNHNHDEKNKITSLVDHYNFESIKKKKIDDLVKAARKRLNHGISVKIKKDKNVLERSMRSVSVESSEEDESEFYEEE